jgi:hypothetical protein
MRSRCLLFAVMVSSLGTDALVRLSSSGSRAGRIGACASGFQQALVAELFEFGVLGFRDAIS